ncbi:MAG: hypothetical protein MPW14_14800 [Candidatus Manganitrophus sp.]|nr:MAG: hypothetical protein MPW14_14800 [Candidatus Manganitrophus sp.]
MAERLRNLGGTLRSPMSPAIVSRRRRRSGVGIACGSLAVGLFYMIAQMVGAGQLIKLLFRPRITRRSSGSAWV